LKRIKLFLSVCGLALALAQPAVAAAGEGVTFSIGFHEKRIYYLGDTQHPVLLSVSLTNDSDRTYRFKVAENRSYNLEFEASTPAGLMVNHAQKFIKLKNANQPVFCRDFSLEPGERYGLVVSLEDFLQFEKPGVYTIQGLFYPELSAPPGAAAPLRSNLLTLNLRPAVVLPEEKARIEAETGALIAREPLPPDEVVGYTLNARQKSQWEKFFLYLDLERLYTQNPARRESYRRMSEEARRAALASYRKQLEAQVTDGDIVLIPSSFEILQTSYTPFAATVIVTERFKQRDFTEVKRFTYSLERRDRIWLITGYETLNLATE